MMQGPIKLRNLTAFVGNGFNKNNDGKREVSRNVNIKNIN
jgi:hypothetical protein